MSDKHISSDQRSIWVRCCQREAHFGNDINQLHGLIPGLTHPLINVVLPSESGTPDSLDLVTSAFAS
jgi:hypothetical protein